MYSFRFFRDRRDALVCPNLAALREELRAYVPWNTVFRAISQGNGRYVVLMLSPYVIGPAIEGYLTIEAHEVDA